MCDVPAALGLSSADTAEVLAAAGLAPSLHNSQPWAFDVTADVIELHADPARRMPVADPRDRELRIACGAALLNLRIALGAKGAAPRPRPPRVPRRDPPC